MLLAFGVEAETVVASLMKAARWGQADVLVEAFARHGHSVAADAIDLGQLLAFHRVLSRECANFARLRGQNCPFSRAIFGAVDGPVGKSGWAPGRAGRVLGAILASAIGGGAGGGHSP